MNAANLAKHPSLSHLEEESGYQYELLPNNFHSPGLASSLVIAAAHELYGFTVSNTNAAAQFLLVFDLTALPSDGAVPDIVFTMGGAADKGVQYLPPRKIFRGLVMCNSSTAGTKTIGAADCFFDLQYL